MSKVDEGSRSRGLDLSRVVLKNLMGVYAHARHLSELYRSLYWSSGELDIVKQRYLYFYKCCFPTVAYNVEEGPGRFSRFGGTCPVAFNLGIVFMRFGMGHSLKKQEYIDTATELCCKYFVKFFRSVEKKDLSHHLSLLCVFCIETMVSLSEFKDAGFSLSSRFSKEGSDAAIRYRIETFLLITKYAEKCLKDVDAGRPRATSSGDDTSAPSPKG